jgi:hypothetical protein
MLPRAGAPGPQRGSAVDAVATVIAGTGTGRLHGQPREAGVGSDAGRAGLSCILVRSARGLLDLEPDVGSRVAPDPPLHAVPEDAHDGVFEVIDVGDAGSGVLYAGPAVHYFTARVKPTPKNPSVHQRQDIYRGDCGRLPRACARECRNVPIRTWLGTKALPRWLLDHGRTV